MLVTVGTFMIIIKNVCKKGIDVRLYQDTSFT